MTAERPPADTADTDLLGAGLAWADAVLAALAGALELAGLEARLAARSLARALLLAFLGLLLLLTAGVFAHAALVAGLLAAGLPAWAALAVTAAVDAAGFGLTVYRRREVMKGARFRATRRQLAHLARPAYGDAGTTP